MQRREGRHQKKGLSAKAAMVGMDLRPVALAVTNPLNGARLAVPGDVRADAERIEWHLNGGWKEGEAAAGCLWAFVSLANEDNPESFARFARRYGVLGLLPDGGPGVAVRDWQTEIGPLMPPSEVDDEATWFGEPLDWWRAWSNNAKAVLALAVALRDDQRIDPRRVLEEAKIETAVPDLKNEHVAAIDPNWSEHTIEDARSRWWFRLRTELAPSRIVDIFNGKDLAKQRDLLGRMLTTVWLDNAALSPSLTWDGAGPMTTLALRGDPDAPPLWPANSLFNVLAVQLAAAISDRRVTTCSKCGSPYSVKQRVTQDGRCEDCGRRERSASQARRRAKLKAEGASLRSEPVHS